MSAATQRQALNGLVIEQLRAHRNRVRGLYEPDRAAGLAGVWLPEDEG